MHKSFTYFAFIAECGKLMLKDMHVSNSDATNSDTTIHITLTSHTENKHNYREMYSTNSRLWNKICITSHFGFSLNGRGRFVAVLSGSDAMECSNRIRAHQTQMWLICGHSMWFSCIRQLELGIIIRCERNVRTIAWRKIVIPMHWKIMKHRMCRTDMTLPNGTIWERSEMLQKKLGSGRMWGNSIWRNWFLIEICTKQTGKRCLIPKLMAVGTKMKIKK